jgi:hypothetical protein
MTPKAVAFDEFIAERNFYMQDDREFTKSTADEKARHLHKQELFVAAIRNGVFRRLSFHTCVENAEGQAELRRKDSYIHVASGRRLKVDIVKEIVRGKLPAPRALRTRAKVDKTIVVSDAYLVIAKTALGLARPSINRTNFDAARLALQASVAHNLAYEAELVNSARLAWQGDLARALHAGHNSHHLLNGNWNQPSADAAPVATAHSASHADCPPPAEYLARPRLMPAPRARCA